MVLLLQKHGYCRDTDPQYWEVSPTTPEIIQNSEPAATFVGAELGMSQIVGESQLWPFIREKSSYQACRSLLHTAMMQLA